VIAWKNSNYTVSNPVTVDAAHPFPSLELIQKSGKTISGRIVDAQDRGLAGLTLGLYYQPSAEHLFSDSGIITGPNGEFLIPEVNFDVPGTYRLSVLGRTEYKPVGTWEIRSDTPAKSAFKVVRPFSAPVSQNTPGTDSTEERLEGPTPPREKPAIAQF
jgi:hypothetical protein